MDKHQAITVAGIDNIITESLTSCIEEIFDDRNENAVDEAIEFVNCLRSLTHCENPQTSDIIKNALSGAMEGTLLLEENNIPFNQISNIKLNMGNSHISDNHPLPDVHVFTTLYDKGYIKDSYVQKHIASQIQSIRSTSADLMGSRCVGQALRPSTSQGELGDWIECNQIYDWNKSLSSGSWDELPFTKSLIGSILFRTSNLEKSIVDGTYEDMTVNALMCHEFATVAALIVEQGNHDLENNFKILDEMLLFHHNLGGNRFFLCCCMVVNLAIACLIRAIGDEAKSDEERKKLHQLWEKCVEYAKSFEQWIADNRSASLLLPNRDIYPQGLSSLLQKIERKFGFRISSDEAKRFGIPTPILMKGRVRSENEMETYSGLILEESEEIGRGMTEIETLEWTLENSNGHKDIDENSESVSLVERFQVETVPEMVDENVFQLLTGVQVHEAIMKHQNRLFNNALRYNHGALKLNLAENLIMLEWVRPMLSGDLPNNLSSQDKKLLKDDVIQMEYQNRKYIGVVETDSLESLRSYAMDNKAELIANLQTIVNSI